MGHTIAIMNASLCIVSLNGIAGNFLVTKKLTKKLRQVIPKGLINLQAERKKKKKKAKQKTKLIFCLCIHCGRVWGGSHTGTLHYKVFTEDLNQIEVLKCQ